MERFNELCTSLVEADRSSRNARGAEEQVRILYEEGPDNEWWWCSNKQRIIWEGPDNDYDDAHIVSMKRVLTMTMMMMLLLWKPRIKDYIFDAVSCQEDPDNEYDDDAPTVEAKDIVAGTNVWGVLRLARRWTSIGMHYVFAPSAWAPEPVYNVAYFKLFLKVPISIFNEIA
jgi:hypothetical protein